jgi:hypothetical protein
MRGVDWWGGLTAVNIVPPPVLGRSRIGWREVGGLGRRGGSGDAKLEMMRPQDGSYVVLSGPDAADVGISCDV